MLIKITYLILMKWNPCPDFQNIVMIMEDLMLGGEWIVCSTVLFSSQLQEVEVLIWWDGII
jgi:hypothetical protein